MGKLLQLAEHLKTINLEAEVLSIIADIEPQLIDLNTSQLFSGVDSKGFLLKPPYKEAWYAEFKKSLNAKGVVDLKLTGKFYEGWFVSASEFPIFFGSKDEKTPDLESKYGKDIFGLTKTNLANITSQTILPILQKRVYSLIHV
jgi:hypothetical protein